MRNGWQVSNEFSMNPPDKGWDSAPSDNVQQQSADAGGSHAVELAIEAEEAPGGAADCLQQVHHAVLDRLCLHH